MLIPWGAHKELSFRADFPPAKLGTYESLYPGRADHSAWNRPLPAEVIPNLEGEVSHRCLTSPLQGCLHSGLAAAHCRSPSFHRAAASCSRKPKYEGNGGAPSVQLGCNREEYFPLLLLIFPEKSECEGWVENKMSQQQILSYRTRSDEQNKQKVTSLKTRCPHTISMRLFFTKLLRWTHGHVR